MKKIIISILVLVILLPSVSFAMIPGANKDNSNKNTLCIIWREGMGDRRSPDYKGPANTCYMWDDAHGRLYDLEVAVNSLQIQNKQLQRQITVLENRPRVATVIQVKQNPVLIQKVNNLESRMTRVEKIVNYLKNTVINSIISVNNNIKKLLVLLKKL